MTQREQGDGRVVGYCPMGCGRTLFLGAGGYITCSFLECPEPDAVATILDDDESEHVVMFGPAGFTIRHPLRERLRDLLMSCELHAYCEEMDGPPVEPGEYRAIPSTMPGRWMWYQLRRRP